MVNQFCPSVLFLFMEFRDLNAIAPLNSTKPWSELLEYKSNCAMLMRLSRITRRHRQEESPRRFHLRHHRHHRRSFGCIQHCFRLHRNLCYMKSSQSWCLSLGSTAIENFSFSWFIVIFGRSSLVGPTSLGPNQTSCFTRSFF